jgi:hypothetical protein
LNPASCEWQAVFGHLQKFQTFSQKCENRRRHFARGGDKKTAGD